MTDREAFEAWRKDNNFPYTGFGVEIWLAAITHIRENYTICEREPITMMELGDTLYREAQHED